MLTEVSVISQWMPVIAALVGALAAGLVAFFVTQFCENIRRNRERWKSHLNSLVRLQPLLNENLGALSDNMYLASSFKGSISKAPNQTKLYWSKFNPLSKTTSFVTDLLRIHLLNELFSYDQKIRKLNNDIQAAYAGYDAARRSLLAGDQDTKQYAVSLAEYINNTGMLAKFGELVEHETTNLLAYVRAALKLDRKLLKRFLWALPKPLPVSEKEKNRELTLISEEIETILSISRDVLAEHFDK